MPIMPFLPANEAFEPNVIEAMRAAYAQALTALGFGGDALHLLAAGIWVGALVPLAILSRHSLRTRTTADARATHQALEKFSGIGPAVVSVLILTGLINSWFLIGPAQWRDLFTTVYGWALLAKLALFAGMLGLAAGNRYWLTPRVKAAIAQNQSLDASHAALRTSVATETGLAFLVLLIVSLLGLLEPPAAT